MLDEDAGVVLPDVEGDSRELVLKCLEDAKTVLNAKEAKILRMHYEDNLNLREIADTFNISRERVRQLHDVAIAKLARVFKRAGVNAQGEV